MLMDLKDIRKQPIKSHNYSEYENTRAWEPNGSRPFRLTKW